MTDRTHNSTENPPAASGADLVEGAQSTAGPLLVATTVLGDGVVSTEDPPHDHGAVVVEGDDQQATAEPVIEALPQSQLESGGLHAADVTGLEEHQVG